MPDAADLTYYIFEGILTGFVEGRMIHMSALSGGGGGSTTRKSVDPVTNNPYAAGLKTTGAPRASGHVHGGPIPPGTYTIRPPAIHPHLGLSAKLEHRHWRPMGRDGFFIHYRGPHGSDGCIVPLLRAQFDRLMTGLTRSNGGILVVAETTDGNRFA
jgi:hypothetical protein